MKAFYKSIMLIAAAAMTFVSCQKEIDNQEIDNGPKMKTIKVSTDIATRTTLNENHENLVWASGDKISVFNNIDVNNFGVTYSPDSEDGAYITVQVPENTTEIYAHYPYYSGNTSGPTTASIYIPNNQTQTNPGELNGYNFPMVAKGTVSANKALVSFYPVAGALALNIYNTALDGSENVESVTVTPSGNTGFVGSQITDLTEDNIKYTNSTGTNASVTVTLTNKLSLANSKPSDKQMFEGQIYVCLAKQSYAKVKFTIKTDKNTYTITSSESSAFDLVDNDFIPVNINLSKASTSNVTITSGDYVVLSKEGSSYYAMATTPNASSERRDLVEFTYDGSGSASTADPTLVWSINKSESIYTFSGVGKYLTAGSNTAPLTPSIDNAGEFTITPGSSDDGSVQVHSGERFLKRNGTYGFGFYNSSEDLFLIPVTYTGNPVIIVDTDPWTLSATDTETKTLSVDGYLYSSLTVGAFSNIQGTTSSDWLTATYTNGTISFSATENTSTSNDRVAYIVVTATKGDKSTTATIQVTQAKVPVPATEGDILWKEDFSGFAANDVPSSSNNSTVVYGDVSLDYSCVLAGTKVYDDQLAGGAKPEILVAKSGGSFTATGIPTGSATNMALSFKANNTNLSVTSTTDGITINKVSDKSYSIVAASGVTSFNLVFSNGKSSNVRLDDITVVVGEVAPVVATPAFSPTAGEVNVNTQVTISCATDGATIYYTTDGTDPTTSSTRIQGNSVTIDVAKTIKAYAIKDGCTPSDVATAAYTIPSSGSEETMTFSNLYSSNTVLDGITIAGKNFSVVFNKKDGGTATQYYTNGYAVRWYGGGSMKISAENGKTITGISIHYSQTANSVSSDVGSYTLSNNIGTWTGSSNSSVTFSQSGSTGQCRITSITVTYN